MRERSGAQVWEGIGVKHCEVQVVRGGAGGQGPLKSNDIEQQQWAKNLRAWEGPSAHGGEGGSKKWVWDVVGGGSEASRESKTRRSERMAGWFGCGRGSGRAR